jgi:hypothetical protein
VETVEPVGSRSPVRLDGSVIAHDNGRAATALLLETCIDRPHPELDHD